ncbi:hypothetical protein CROQUDRAFT_718497 [Cronartium quercuum f. sp. fusiforme G11]|uniref:ZZ-type domain-containing protein n=1 Tax=Cronartium quercuum f. sp. fusiforme G11 TaxID=708437 RepID=A0A9P6N7I0_9BASI|nr:hypothetical protein CROQUDRAFT_718497 [Cronartium quercuum f. sp. fusiforme G11]
MIPTHFVFKVCLASSDQSSPALNRKYSYTGTVLAEDVYKGLHTRAEQSFNLLPGTYDLAITVPLNEHPLPLESYAQFRETLNFVFLDPNPFKIDYRSRTVLTFVVTPKPLSQRDHATAAGDSRRSDVRHKGRLPPLRRCMLRPASSFMHSVSPIFESPERRFQTYGSSGRPTFPSTNASQAFLELLNTDTSTQHSGDGVPPSVCPPEVVHPAIDVQPSVGVSSEGSSLFNKPCTTFQSTSSTLASLQETNRQIREQRRDLVRAVNQGVARKLAGFAMGPHRQTHMARTIPTHNSRETPSTGSSTVPDGRKPACDNGVSQKVDRVINPTYDVGPSQNEDAAINFELPEHQQNYPYFVNPHFNFSNLKSNTESQFAGIYNTIISQAFHSNPRYTVIAQVRSGITIIEVYYRADNDIIRPVLVAQCFPLGALSGASGRKQADDLIRARFISVSSHVAIPRFHALSLCGSKTRFYMLDTSSGLILPKHENIPAPNRVLPRDFLGNAWQCDLTTSIGISTLKSVLADVRAMSEGLTTAQAHIRLHLLNEVTGRLLRPLSSGSVDVGNAPPSHNAVQQTMPGAFTPESSVLENPDGVTYLSSFANLSSQATWPDGLFSEGGGPVYSIGNLNRVIHAFFGTTDFIVSPAALFPVHSGGGSVLRFIVRNSKEHPVLLVQVSPTLATAQDRHETDMLMRQFYEHSWGSCVLPQLHGISVSHHSVRFYTLDTITRLISPISDSMPSINHVLPHNYLANAWNYHLSSQACFEKLKDVVIASMRAPSLTVKDSYADYVRYNTESFRVLNHYISDGSGLASPHDEADSEAPQETPTVHSSTVIDRSPTIGSMISNSTYSNSHRYVKENDSYSNKHALGESNLTPQVQLTSESPQETLAVHFGIVCDGCARTIKGVRAKCNDCPDYDLCPVCYPLRFDFHADLHEFALHATPLESPDNMADALVKVVSARTADEAHRSVIICDRCSKKITGIRAKCSHLNCPDFDLCDKCYPVRGEMHPADHTFSITTMETDARDGDAQAPAHKPGTKVQFPGAKVVHMADCDLCGKGICGTRWKCVECEDWDCCEGCLDGVQAHHPFHQLLPITCPDIVKPEVREPVRHRNILCDGCNKEIVGVRYKCTHPSCDDYDLCSGCESHPIPRHDSDHVMLKIRDSQTWEANSRLAHKFNIAPCDHSRSSAPLVARTGKAVVDENVVPPMPQITHTGYAVVIRPPDSQFKTPVARTSYAVLASSGGSCSIHSSNSTENSVVIDHPKESRLTSLSESFAPGTSTSDQTQCDEREDSLTADIPSVPEVERTSSLAAGSGSPAQQPSFQTPTGEVYESPLVVTLATPEPTQGRFEVDDSSLNDISTTSRISEFKVSAQHPTPTSHAGAPSAKNVISTSTSPISCTSELTARYVSDLNLADGTAVSAGSRFTKIWLVHNSGSVSWPVGTQIAFTGGFSNGAGTAFSVPSALPNEVVEVAVDSMAPDESGEYCQFWRLMNPSGVKFGDRLWLRLKVVMGGDQLGVNDSAISSLSASASFHLPRFTASGTLESSTSAASPPVNELRAHAESLVSSLNQVEANENRGTSEHTHSLTVGSDAEFESEWSHEQFNSSLGQSTPDDADDFEIVTDSDSSSDGESVVEV